MIILITNKRKQKGIALLMSLIMLLVITVIGVGAVKMSLNDTQIAGNTIYEGIVFQGAESGLNRSLSNSDLYDLKIPATDRLTTNTIDDLPVETVIGGGKLNTEGSIKYELTSGNLVISSIPNSTEFQYQVFTVSAESKLQGTAARDRHSEGRALQVPK